ncbi:MAG: ABC transporter ATP-binding protein [Pseudomonadota bacterium]
MPAIVSIDRLSKTYASGFEALREVSLEIQEGEILALLGPNGAGKTTLISVICGIVTPSTGRVSVGGHDVISDFRAARRLLGLVPQELVLEPFETPMTTARFSRGLFGHARDDERIEAVLRELSLWEKRDSQNRELSGGMKRRVLIAKALSHEPTVLFLDEPSAGVDVELRKEMWAIVERLRERGVTIILTTHYIEEAEAIADRIAVINKGELLLVEDKATLMKRFGRKCLRVELSEPCDAIPGALAGYALERSDDGMVLSYTYDTQGDRTGITGLLNDLRDAGLTLRDVQTAQSSLEDIFVDLVRDDA